MKLWYRETGDPHLPKLVFLHGLLASSQNWQGIVKRLKNDYHIFNLDLPNHGQSPHTEKANYAEMVDSVYTFLEEQHLERVTIIGHSMGGKAAMLLATQFPEKINRLIIEDIAPKTYPPKFKELILAMKNLKLNDINSRKEADEQLKHDIPDIALRMFVLTNLMNSPNGFYWRVNLEGLLHGIDELVSFPKIQTTSGLLSLFLCGSESEYVKEEDHSTIKSLFNNATIQTIDNAGHWLHSQQPDLFTDKLQNFLTSRGV